MAVLIAVCAIAACAPLSPEAAARICEDRARAAAGPTGAIEIGAGSRGVTGGIAIGVTNDYLAGRDPYDVYDSCVRARSGDGPVRPLSL